MRTIQAQGVPQMDSTKSKYIQTQMHMHNKL